jgi:hypothetical protein
LQGTHAKAFHHNVALEEHAYEDTLKMENAVRSVGLWVILTLVACSGE